jgi:hypothetical protein
MIKLNTIYWKYLQFLLIGVAAFYISGYVLRGIHPPTNFLYGLLIFVFLFIIGLIRVRDFSYEFIIKAFALSFGALFLIFSVFFVWSAINESAGSYLYVEKVDTVPDEYATINEEELNEYPAIRKAIEKQERARVKESEYRKILSLFQNKGTWYIKYQNEYYEVTIEST